MTRGRIAIRKTAPADLDAIVAVHKKGFGYDREAEPDRPELRRE